eukprot:TRINITY_DN6036_c1_g1_i2.p2 TRINITY_DN6036_c1_g1~~TRINITY_DN6036_c1_g1_i2.p2  ORF type:complete len:179 (+),score=25.91 TRINITY_DN6036_c1_g1_i2:435-971(+)
MEVSTTARENDTVTILGAGWKSCFTRGFTVGSKELYTAEIVKAGANQNIMIGVCDMHVNCNIYPRDPRRGMWYVMLCWGGGVYYDGKSCSAGRFVVKDGERVCLAVSKDGALGFRVQSASDVHPLLADLGQLPLNTSLCFFVSMYEESTCVRWVPPNDDERRFGGAVHCGEYGRPAPT